MLTIFNTEKTYIDKFAIKVKILEFKKTQKFFLIKKKKKKSHIKQNCEEHFSLLPGYYSEITFSFPRIK